MCYRRRLEKGYEDMQDGTVPIKRKLGTNPKVLQCRYCYKKCI